MGSVGRRQETRFGSRVLEARAIFGTGHIGER